MRILALLLALLAACSGCVSVPSHDDLRATAHQLRFEHSICSGTSISLHQIRSASHCFGHGDLKLVDNQPAKVVRVVDNGHDISTVTVDRAYQHYARATAVPLQGMRIRWFGNPEGVPDIYREGVIVSVMSDGIIIDATICHGDSGAGVFDDAGELVGVVSAMTDGNGCTFMLANPEPTI